MKKISGFISLVVILGGFTIFTSCHNDSSSASNFEGVISYQIKAGAGVPAEISSMFQTMEMKTFVKGSLTRSEEAIAGNKNVVIADSKKPDDPIMLISMMGHNYAVKRNDSLKKIAESNAPKIEYIDSSSATKQIAGYTCKKAKISISMPNNGGSMTSDLYYAPDLPYADPQGQFKGLKGMPMEYSINMSGLNITISAKLVEKKPLADSLFTVPSGYKEMDINQMQKDLMKSVGNDTTANGTK
jgi:GLPGLI family protein